MKIAVVIPYRPDGGQRDRLLAWTSQRYAEALPDVPVVLGDCNPDRPFNRAEGIVTGALRVDADVLIVADGDCWSDGIFDAIEQVRSGTPWAVPHLRLHRLTEQATERVLAGGRPEDQDDYAERPYKGHAAGTLLVIPRSTLLDVPPDVRMTGWGQEDDAWALALRGLVGKPWRGEEPCWHLWHAPQPRRDRGVGNETNLALYRRYKACRYDPVRMRALVEEGKSVRVDVDETPVPVAALNGAPVADEVAVDGHTVRHPVPVARMGDVR